MCQEPVCCGCTLVALTYCVKAQHFICVCALLWQAYSFAVCCSQQLLPVSLWHLTAAHLSHCASQTASLFHATCLKVLCVCVVTR